MTQVPGERQFDELLHEHLKMLPEFVQHMKELIAKLTKQSAEYDELKIRYADLLEKAHRRTNEDMRFHASTERQFASAEHRLDRVESLNPPSGSGEYPDAGQQKTKAR